jgi:predicted metal-dependent phosphoesterase TrpH
MCEIPGLRSLCRESYNPPREVYARLKRLGMDLVTVTDHDSIDGAEALRRHSDFFLSEEVSCLLPGGNRLHLGVYDIEERDHTELQRRATDFLSLIAYLRERRLFFSANHIFSGLTGPRSLADFAWLSTMVPAFETRNGALLARNNRQAAAFAARTDKCVVGGSDAHAMPTVGTAYTVVAGSRTRREFLDALRAGRARAEGQSGSYYKLTRDVLLVAANFIRENPGMAVLAPLMLAVPLVTLGNQLRDAFFGHYWMTRLNRERWLALPARSSRGDLDSPARPSNTLSLKPQTEAA